MASSLARRERSPAASSVNVVDAIYGKCGLVFEAHRLVCHTTLSWRVIKQKKIQGLGSGSRVQGSGFRVQGSGFRVQGSGFRVQVSGFRVQGVELRVDLLHRFAA